MTEWLSFFDWVENKAKVSDRFEERGDVPCKTVAARWSGNKQTLEEVTTHGKQYRCFGV